MYYFLSLPKRTEFSGRPHSNQNMKVTTHIQFPGKDTMNVQIANHQPSNTFKYDALHSE